MSVDPERLSRELAADADVLRSLRSNGDVPSLSREVDVSFKGDRDRLATLAKAAPQLGWKAYDIVLRNDGSSLLTLSRIQTADELAISDLTKEALEIESSYSVVYDGWGCIAVTYKN